MKKKKKDRIDKPEETKKKMKYLKEIDKRKRIKNQNGKINLAHFVVVVVDADVDDDVV